MVLPHLHGRGATDILAARVETLRGPRIKPLFLDTRAVSRWLGSAGFCAAFPWNSISGLACVASRWRMSHCTLVVCVCVCSRSATASYAHTREAARAPCTVVAEVVAGPSSRSSGTNGRSIVLGAPA